jgi:SAM-dependent methyltransferase
MEKTVDYWNQRYKNTDIPWDTGTITTPLKAYFDQLSNKGMRILVPGCGVGHEATYLFEQGFEQVFVCDWAEEALLQFQANTKGFPTGHLLQGAFFRLAGAFDLIVEQTFFCAIPPSQRVDYVEQCYSLLRKGGKVTGLLFNVQFPDGPPFGGSQGEYETLFSKKFNILTMRPCTTSIKPRMGSELFFEIEKSI